MAAEEEKGAEAVRAGDAEEMAAEDLIGYADVHLVPFYVRAKRVAMLANAAVGVLVVLVVTRLRTMLSEPDRVYIVAVGDGGSLEWASALSQWACHVCVVERSSSVRPGRDESGLRPNISLHRVCDNEQLDLERLQAAYVHTNLNRIMARELSVLLISDAPLSSHRAWSLVYPSGRQPSAVLVTGASRQCRAIQTTPGKPPLALFALAPSHMTRPDTGSQMLTPLQISSFVSFTALGVALLLWRQHVAGCCALGLVATSHLVHAPNAPAVSNKLHDFLDYAFIVGLLACTFPVAFRLRDDPRFLLVVLLIGLVAIAEHLRPCSHYKSPGRTSMHMLVHTAAALAIAGTFFCSRYDGAMLPKGRQNALD